ncbi:hypothetical protein J601_3764 [Acinetobacter baumannii 831240]|nr:hypothetical protein J601_3764 [Acinetobacter baumannii 831240]
MTLDFSQLALSVVDFPPTTWTDILFAVLFCIAAFCFAVWLLFYAK